jgi:hypothetical protein
MTDWLRLHLVFRQLLRFGPDHPARAIIASEVRQCLRLRRVLVRNARSWK